jgi:hypothetical protein
MGAKQWGPLHVKENILERSFICYLERMEKI